MCKKRKDPIINPYKVLGVSDKRADEMSAELVTLDSESRYIEDVITTLAKRYDPETLVMGMFLGALIMHRERRLLPPGARRTITNPSHN